MPATTLARPQTAPLAAPAGLVVAFCLIWSSAFAAAKLALADCPPLLLLSARFLLAGLIMLAAARWIGGPIRLARRDLLVLAMLGVLNNAVYLGLSWTGMRTVSSGLTAIIISANPVLTALSASLWLGEPMTRTRATGLALGIAGIVIVLRDRLDSGLEDPQGVVLVLGALLSLVAGTVLFKKLRPGTGLWLGNGVQCLAAGLALAPVALSVEQPARIVPSLSLALSLLYLVLVVSVAGYLLWFRLLSRASATAASALHFLMPPLGLLFGWALLGETVPPLDLLGVVPIALGIHLVTRRR